MRNKKRHIIVRTDSVRKKNDSDKKPDIDTGW